MAASSSSVSVSSARSISSTHSIESLLVFQDVLTHYRVPLFNKLVERLKIPIVVATGDFAPSLQHNELEFEVKIFPKVQIGPLYYFRGLRKELSKHSVVVFPFDLHQLSTWSAALRRKGPMVLWGHSHGSRKYLNFARQKMVSCSDAILVYTEFGKQRLVDDGAVASKVFVANNTVEVQNAGFDDTVEKNTFLFAGRLTPRKKVAELLEAFAKIESEIPEHIKVEIVGDGSERERLEQLATDKGIAHRVTFRGEVYCDEQLKRLFQSALAYVSPGHVGLGVLHSFAYGVPPITRRDASHAPEFAHIKEGENGLLFDGSVDELAAIMKSLCFSDASQSLGQNAFRYYQDHCTIAHAVDGFEAAIAHAIIERSKK